MLHLQPLGDQAALASFSDEEGALRFSSAMRATAPPWLVDVVQAYATVAVFYSLDAINYHHVREWLSALEQTHTEGFTPPARRLHRIPCCYEKQLDLKRIAEHTGLAEEEVIRLHTETVYTIYAIGFCPGFPYLGYLPPALSGVPRLSSPR